MTQSRSQVLGINYTTTYGSSSAIAALGSYDHGVDGTRWMFVRASSAIAADQCVTIDENFLAIPCTQAAVADQHRIGFAQSAIAANKLGWVAISGSNITHNTLKSCAADVSLYATASAGFLDDAVSSGHLIVGVVAVTAATSAAGGASVEILASWPMSGTANQVA